MLPSFLYYRYYYFIVSVKLITHLFSTFVTNIIKVNIKKTYALFGISQIILVTYM